MRRTALVLVIAGVLTLLPACSLQSLWGSSDSEVAEPPTAKPPAVEHPAKPPPLQAPEGFRAVLRPATWALERVSHDGTVIWIRSAESGCYTFHHAVVKEVEGGLRVRPLDRVLIPKPGYGCILPLYARRYRVELPRPLGKGEIFGECVPGDATGEQRICARMHEAANP